MINKSNFKEFLKVGAGSLSVFAMVVGFATIMTHQKEVDENLHNIFGKTVFSNIEDVRLGILNKEAFKDVPKELRNSYYFFIEEKIDTIEYKKSLKDKEFFEYELAGVKQTREDFLTSQKEMEEMRANDPEYQRMKKEHDKIRAELAKKSDETKNVVVIDLLKEVTQEEKEKYAAERMKREQELMKEPPTQKIVLKSIHSMREKIKSEAKSEVNEELNKVKPKT